MRSKGKLELWPPGTPWKSHRLEIRTVLLGSILIRTNRLHQGTSGISTQKRSKNVTLHIVSSTELPLYSKMVSRRAFPLRLPNMYTVATMTFCVLDT